MWFKDLWLLYYSTTIILTSNLHLSSAGDVNPRDQGQGPGFWELDHHAVPWSNKTSSAPTVVVESDTANVPIPAETTIFSTQEADGPSSRVPATSKPSHMEESTRNLEDFSTATSLVTTDSDPEHTPAPSDETGWSSDVESISFTTVDVERPSTEVSFRFSQTTTFWTPIPSDVENISSDKSIPSAPATEHSHIIEEPLSTSKLRPSPSTEDPVPTSLPVSPTEASTISTPTVIPEIESTSQSPSESVPTSSQWPPQIISPSEEPSPSISSTQDSIPGSDISTAWTGLPRPSSAPTEVSVSNILPEVSTIEDGISGTVNSPPPASSLQEITSELSIAPTMTRDIPLPPLVSSVLTEIESIISSIPRPSIDLPSNGPEVPTDKLPSLPIETTQITPIVPDSSTSFFIELLPSTLTPSNLVPTNLIPTDLAPTFGSTWIVPSNIVPTDLVPSNIVPSNIAPSNIVPTDLVPTNIVPSNIVPSNIVPSNIVPTDLVPSNIVPTDLVPSNLVPTEFLPSNIVPTNLLPSVGTFLSSVVSEIDSQFPPIPIASQTTPGSLTLSEIINLPGTGLPLPTPSFPGPSGIPVSETVQSSVLPPLLSTLLPISSGLSLPGVPGSGVLPLPTDILDLSSETGVGTSSAATRIDESLGVPTSLSAGNPGLSSNETQQPSSGPPTVPTSESLFRPTTLATVLPSSDSSNTGGPGESSGSPGSSTVTGIFPSDSAAIGTATEANSSSGRVDSLVIPSGGLSEAVSETFSSTATGPTTVGSDSPSSTGGAPEASETNQGSSTSSALSDDDTDDVASTTDLTGSTKSTTIIAPVASSTEEAAAASEPDAPPLTKSQTAGIAIGGTTCLIIALVAALFLARRYHTNNAKRKSAVSPDMAVPYDPPMGSNGDAEAGGGIPAMSGGRSGYGAVPINSPRNSMGAMPQDPFRDPIIPSPEPSPRLNGYGGPLGDPKGQYAQFGANPFRSEYPPMSPYGSAANLQVPKEPVRVSQRDSDPFADPFEHDLLLNVRSETPDSIVMLAAAPPSTPRSPYYQGRYSPEGGNGSRSSFAPPPAPVVPHFPNDLSRDIGNGSSAFLLPPYSRSNAPTPDNSSSSSLAAGRYTPESSSNSPNLSSHTTNSPAITPPRPAASPPPIHKGWDDIKYDESIMPKPLNLTPNRKPVPQRRQPPLSGTGQVLLSGTGLPMTVKRKELGSAPGQKTGQGLAPPLIDRAYGSPGPTIDGYSRDPVVRKKRSEYWADPQLIGKSAF